MTYTYDTGLRCVQPAPAPAQAQGGFRYDQSSPALTPIWPSTVNHGYTYDAQRDHADQADQPLIVEKKGE